MKHLASLILLFIIFTICTSQKAKVSFVIPPTFFTCVQNNPPLPATAGPGIQASIDATKAGECQGGDISGRYFIANFAADQGTVPAGKLFHQVVDAAVIVKKTRVICGDRQFRMTFHVIEYFTTPAIDHQVAAFCCEVGRIESVSVKTALMDQLPGMQPPIPGFGGAGLPFTTADQRRVAENNITNAYNVFWGYRYEYDACDPRAPHTTCGQVHCLTPWKEVSKETSRGKHWVDQSSSFGTYHN